MTSAAPQGTEETRAAPWEVEEVERWCVELELLWGDVCLGAGRVRGAAGTWALGPFGGLPESAAGRLVRDGAGWAIVLPAGARGVFHDGHGHRVPLTEALQGLAPPRKLKLPAGAEVAWILSDPPAAAASEYRSSLGSGAAAPAVLRVRVVKSWRPPPSAWFPGLGRPFLAVLLTAAVVAAGFSALHFTRRPLTADDIETLAAEQAYELQQRLIEMNEVQRGESGEETEPVEEGIMGSGLAPTRTYTPWNGFTILDYSPEELETTAELFPWLTEMYCLPVYKWDDRDPTLPGAAGWALARACYPYLRGMKLGEPTLDATIPPGVSRDEWLRRTRLFAALQPPPSLARARLSRPPYTSNYQAHRLDSEIRRRLWAIAPCSQLMPRNPRSPRGLHFDVYLQSDGTPTTWGVELGDESILALNRCVSLALADVRVPLPAPPSHLPFHYTVSLPAEEPGTPVAR